MSDRPVGFEVPLHRSLTRPIFFGGAPRNVTILIATLAAAIGIGLHLWWAGLILWGFGQTAAVFMARRDPDFFLIGVHHLRLKPFFGV